MIGERPSIFVTGAGSGIGRETARLFAARGWFVGLYDINGAAVAQLGDELGSGNACFGTLDVRSSNNWSQVLSAFWEQSGQRLDVLFNNAGILTTGPLADVAMERHRDMVDINVTAVIAGCHAAFPYLRQMPQSSVVNMSSATGIYGLPDLATYSAAKFAIRGLTEALDLEWRADRVRVRSIVPGFVRTPMADRFAHLPSAKATGIPISAGDVANTVWACANAGTHKRKTHWMVGRQAMSLMFATRFFPGSLTRRLVARISS